MSSRDILNAMESHGCDVIGMEPAALEYLAGMLIRQMALPPEKEDPAILEQGFLKYMYDRLPEDDITDRLIKAV
jgi:hypothetical protein